MSRHKSPLGSIHYRETLKVHMRALTMGSVTGDQVPWCGLSLWFGDNHRLTGDINLVTCGRCHSMEKRLDKQESNLLD